MLNKSLIQFSVDGWGYVPSLYFGLRPNYRRGNGDLLQKDLCQHALPPRTAAVSFPDHAASCCWHRPPPENPKHSQPSMAWSLVGSLILSPGSWCSQGFVCAFQDSVSPVLWKFYNQIPLALNVKFPESSQSLCWIPRLGNLL